MTLQNKHNSNRVRGIKLTLEMLQEENKDELPQWLKNKFEYKAMKTYLKGLKPMHHRPTYGEERVEYKPISIALEVGNWIIFHNQNGISKMKESDLLQNYDICQEQQN